jgi:hypothetical protein
LADKCANGEKAAIYVSFFLKTGGAASAARMREYLFSPVQEFWSAGSLRCGVGAPPAVAAAGVGGCVFGRFGARIQIFLLHLPEFLI